MGGDTKILLEFASRWALLGHHVNIITSESGHKTCQNYDLLNVRYEIISSTGIERLGRPLCHIIQTVKACMQALKNYPSKEGDAIIIYSATNFWPDVIPAVMLKKRLVNSQWVGSCYLPIPSPFKGFEFAYEAKSKLLPDLKTLANYFVEKPSTALLRRFADYIFVTNDLDKSYFSDKGFPSTRLKAIYGGVNLSEIAKVPKQKIEYDGCFVGRIHPMKGVDYLVKIWQCVCKEKPDAKLALIGNGTRDYERKIQNEIKVRKLENNIYMLGYVDGQQKYEILKSSKVFLHTSIYDNSAMAAAEAMACGLPAVRFDIPALRIAYPKGMLVVPLKDCSKFAKAVIQLLEDTELYNQIKNEGLELAEDWNWDQKASNVLYWLSHVN
jgi:glycosyltransferase involved in cell wall biosynthesis